MLILNPLYDWAFKYLMDNNDLARRFLSVVLKAEITHLETRNVEMPLLKEGSPLLTRFDFKAVVEHEGRVREVLIEIQKYKSPDPLARFRAYLGESYLKDETFRTPQGGTETAPLPLVAVYILGFCPPEFDIPYVIVRNVVIDGVTGQEIPGPGPMVDRLTHPAYFLVATPPPSYRWRGSPQEALIRLFRQKAKLEKSNTTYQLDEQPLDPLARDLASYLHQGTMDSYIVRQLKAEEEYYDAIGDLEASLEHERQQREEAQRREAEERQQREEAQRREAEERQQREEAQRREAEKSAKLARMMLAAGAPLEEVMRETGLTPEQIRAL